MTVTPCDLETRFELEGVFESAESSTQIEDAS